MTPSRIQGSGNSRGFPQLAFVAIEKLSSVWQHKGLSPARHATYIPVVVERRLWR